MAEQIPTAIQEEISIDYFDLFTKNGWDVSDRKYRQLLVDSFGRNGKFLLLIIFQKHRRDKKIKKHGDQVLINRL